MLLSGLRQWCRGEQGSQLHSYSIRHAKIFWHTFGTNNGDGLGITVVAVTHERLVYAAHWDFTGNVLVDAAVTEI